MITFKKILLAALMLFIAVPMFADRLPEKVRIVFGQIYPKAQNVQWTEMGGCYVAAFVIDEIPRDVWFTPSAQWVMTENDVESLSDIPQEVTQHFLSSPMAALRLSDIRLITFPNRATVVLIEVEGYNTDSEYQLFYSLDGDLKRTLNTSGGNGEIYPALFDE